MHETADVISTWPRSDDIFGVGVSVMVMADIAPFIVRLRRTRVVIKLAGLLLIIWLTSGVMLSRNKHYGDVSVRSDHLRVNWTVISADGNMTRKHHTYKPLNGDRVIVYNRIPKCASTSVRFLMRELARFHDYNIHSSKIYSQESLNSTAQRLFVQQVMRLRRPLLFIRHVFFVDFTRYHATQPIYINMIREPLDRLVSDYYFKRHNVAYLFPMSAEDRDRTYNECVQQNYTECVGGNPKGYFRIIPYFCGQDPHCFFPSDRSLAQAKRNVEKHFLVVGVVHYAKEYLEVLEKVLPNYFRGASLLYNAGGKKYRKMAKTKHKDPVDSQTVAIMKTKLLYDYDFYAFVKQRFTNQYNTLFDDRLS